MAINTNSSNVATRENRIGSITGYVGNLKDLAEKSECGSLKGCSRCFSQSSTCLSTCGLSQLAAIRDVAVIHHGPAGCSVASAGNYYLDKEMAKKRGIGTTGGMAMLVWQAVVAHEYWDGSTYSNSDIEQLIADMHELMRNKE